MSCTVVAILLSVPSLAVAATSSSTSLQYDTKWKSFVTDKAWCQVAQLVLKNGSTGGTLICSLTNGVRHFKFPVGMFDIDEQVAVPANTMIEGNADPNAASDKTKKSDPSTQTYFIATRGVTDPDAAYCGTQNRMQQGDAQKIRIGFLLHSNTVMKNFNFQGKDTTRPLDNGNLCGGGVFETPGCVSPGFGDGVGNGWVNKRTGCYDHTGAPNTLLIGDGKGVENVTVDSVRLNDLYLPTDPFQYNRAQGSQLAVWVAQTQDGSATKNVQVKNLVSMLTRGDGINYHGNVQNSLVEDCHIENTGDDIYAFWGGYAAMPTGNVFRNNVGKNPGVTRDYMYGVCVAVYGALDLTVSGTECYDLRSWNSGQPNERCKNGAYCNSCLAYVHDGWFGAVYPDGNAIYLKNNKYYYMDATTQEIPSSDRPLIRNDGGSHAHIVSDNMTAAVIV